LPTKTAWWRRYLPVSRQTASPVLWPSTRSEKQTVYKSRDLYTAAATAAVTDDDGDDDDGDE